MAKRTLLASTALLAGLLVGCGGSASGSNGVATLSGAAGSTTATTLSAADAEKVLLDWVTCMRGQGLDIADPTVDANGNLTLAGPGRAGGAAGGGAGQGTAAPDREAFQTASGVCGDPPASSFGFSEEDRAAFQESALQLAQCMRKEGITDFPDPDFSGAGPGGAGAAAQGGGGPFGAVDQTDPKVQAALATCQTQLSDAGVQLPGARAAG